MTKQIIIKCGSYNIHPKDAEETIIKVPEDSIFVTGGENEIGQGKHVGALHILMITKASDEELENASQQCLNGHVVKYSPDGQFDYRNFRVNGYGFMYFTDCIPVEGIEFTDADKFNELLDLANHPIYTILFNDDLALCDATRIDRINSYYDVECKSIQLYSQLGSRYYPMIHTNVSTELYNAIVPFHKFFQYFPEEEYGKELFDELMYTALVDIYPELKSKLKGYDLDWIHKVGKYWCEKSKIFNIVYTKENEEEAKKEIAENLEKFYKEYPEAPDLTDFEEIRTLKKKLPLKTN